MLVGRTRIFDVIGKARGLQHGFDREAQPLLVAACVATRAEHG
jgi:hypothetical protein